MDTFLAKIDDADRQNSNELRYTKCALLRQNEELLQIKRDLQTAQQSVDYLTTVITGMSEDYHRKYEEVIHLRQLLSLELTLQQEKYLELTNLAEPFNSYMDSNILGLWPLPAHVSNTFDDQDHGTFILNFATA